MLRALRDTLSRCILRAMLNSEGGFEPWHSAGPPPELDVARVCDEIGSSIFVASLWVGDPVKAFYEHIERVNSLKVHIDLFVEDAGGGEGRASDEAAGLWERVSGSKSYVDTGCAMKEYTHLEKILFHSNPLKLRDALRLCGSDLSLQVDVCRLYSEGLDTAVGLLSEQVDEIRADVFTLLSG